MNTYQVTLNAESKLNNAIDSEAKGMYEGGAKETKDDVTNEVFDETQAILNKFLARNPQSNISHTKNNPIKTDI